MWRRTIEDTLLVGLDPYALAGLTSLELLYDQEIDREMYMCIYSSDRPPAPLWLISLALGFDEHFLHAFVVVVVVAGASQATKSRAFPATLFLTSLASRPCTQQQQQQQLG